MPENKYGWAQIFLNCIDLPIWTRLESAYTDFVFKKFRYILVWISERETYNVISFFYFKYKLISLLTLLNMKGDMIALKRAAIYDWYFSFYSSLWHYVFTLS